MMAAKHVHRYLPSKGCKWRCRCGAWFVACSCGKCRGPKRGNN